MSDCECSCNKKMTESEFREMLIKVLDNELEKEREGNSYYDFHSPLFDILRRIIKRLLG